MSEQLIKSASTTYNTIVLSVLAFLIISSQLLDQKIRRETFENIELLSAIHSLPDADKRPLDRDLLFNTTRAGRLISDRLSETQPIRTTPSETQYAELGFHDLEVPNSFAVDFQLRSFPLISCTIIYISVDADIAPFIMSLSMGDRSFINKEAANFIYFDASNCVSAYEKDFVGAIVTARESKERVFFIPNDRTSGVDRLWQFGGFIPREGFAYPEIERIFSFLPNQMQTFFKPADSYFSANAPAIEWAILRFASDQTGKLYNFDEEGDALRDLGNSASPNATLLGITAPMHLITLIFPFLLAALLWSLARQLDGIGTASLDKRLGYWPPTHSSGAENLLVSIVYSVAPYLITVFGLIMFCAVHQATWFKFGYIAYIDTSLSLVVAEAPPIGWIRGSTVAGFISGLVMGLCAILSLDVSLRLFGFTVDNWIGSRKQA